MFQVFHKFHVKIAAVLVLLSGGGGGGGGVSLKEFGFYAPVKVNSNEHYHIFPKHFTTNEIGLMPKIYLIIYD